MFRDASVFKRRGFESGTQQETDDKHRSVVRLQSLLSHVTESHTDRYIIIKTLTKYKKEKRTHSKGFQLTHVHLVSCTSVHIKPACTTQLHNNVHTVINTYI